MTAPTAPDELLNLLSDQDKVNDAIKAGTFADMIKAYARHVADSDATLQAQVREQVQATMTEFLKENRDTRPLDLDVNRAPENRYRPLANKAAIGAPLNGVFDNVGEFAQTVWNHTAPQGVPSADGRKKFDAIRAYQEKVPSEGGFLVPEEFRAELLRISLDSAIVRPRARVVPMGSATLRFPAVDSTSNASSVFGGVVAYWTEEGAELTESQAGFSSVKLEAWKLTALAIVTNELLRDAAGGFQMYIEQMFPEAIAWYEDRAFLQGNGVGQPLGALNAGNLSVVTVSKETSQAADTINWLNITKMYARMLPSSLSRAVWVVTPDAFAQLANMTVNVKNVAGTENVGGSAVWLPDGTGTPTLTLLGRPVIMTEQAPAVLGDKGDISFVDFSYYLVGDRQQMTMESSPHVKFTSDKTVFRVIQRVDGRPWVSSAITPANGGPTLSPFVQLETR